MAKNKKEELLDKKITKGDDHIIELKHQVNVTFDENYKFYDKNPIKKFFNWLLWRFAVIVFYVVHFFALGLKRKGRKKVKALRKQKTGFITISNHCLILDSPMVLLMTSPKRTYLPTVEPTMKIPFVRHILKALNVMPIPFNARGLIKFKNECNDLLKQNQVLHFFSEGALWPYYTKLREFQSGAFRFAVDNNVPIMPYCIYFRERKGLWKLLGKKPLATIEALDPIYPNNELGKKQAITDLMQRAHDAMQVVIDAHPFENPDYDNIEAQLNEQKIIM